MPDDDAVSRAARTATASARRRLGSARSQIGSARKAFSVPVGILSWNSIGDLLKRHEGCAGDYRALQEALDAADAAVARAEAACAGLDKAAGRG
ncbi:hypothetical protein [Pseudonocardia sp.]|uniref:hypothetical protein n=1 Tax=Pseudonocardia sp. TaxID=60912 RepID=UPI00262D971C|nr:hypothetical protein [Pseudonocardia sp.]